MNHLDNIKKLINNKNIGIPTLFYCSNYNKNNIDYDMNNTNLITENNNNIIDEKAYSKIVTNNTKKSTLKSDKKNKNKKTKKKKNKSKYYGI